MHLARPRVLSLGIMRTILLVEDDPLQAFARLSALEKRFPGVKRVTDAAEALCLIEQAAFSDNLGLVISSHRPSGLDGPAFVAELHTRMPGLPVLVLGDSLDSAREYSGDWVRFLPRPVATEEMLAAASHMLAKAAYTV
jgi:DNA-binding NtrC family response regulator